MNDQNQKPIEFSEEDKKYISCLSNGDIVYKTNAEDKRKVIIVPEGVTRIDTNGFKKCNANKIILPSTLTYIGDYAFSFCKYLEKIIIPGL